MSKHIITLALCALAVFALSACSRVPEEDLPGNGVDSVTFRARLGSDTRTGLSLKFVPDWRETDLDNVHLFRIDEGQTTEGQNIELFLKEGEYDYAFFRADFPNNPLEGNASGSLSSVSSDVYGSVVAQMSGGRYIVPSVQYPGAETLIDPDADFLVGSSVGVFVHNRRSGPIDLAFIRPVAVSRLSILNLGGTVVKSVTVTSADKLTGCADPESIDYTERSVTFDPSSGSEVLTLSYGEGAPLPAEGIFNAYFVSLTGAKKILEVVVETDAGTYTKNLGQAGKTLTFQTPDFKSIAVNMSGEGFSVELQPQEISFVKNDGPISTDTYDLYTTEDYVSPTLAGVVEGATVTYDSSDPGVATVSKTGVVTPVGVGETTITAVASKTETHEEGHAEFVLLVVDSTPLSQTLSFDPASLSVYVDQEVTPPTLSGAHTAVKYSSSVPYVADVDPDTGALTLKAEGTTTIKAVAEAGFGTDGVYYAEGEGSYILSVSAAE